MALPSNYYRKKLRGLRRIWKKELRYLNELAAESDNDIEIAAPLIIPFTGKTRKFKQKYRNELFYELIRILDQKINKQDGRYYLLFYPYEELHPLSANILIYDSIDEVRTYFRKSNVKNHEKYRSPHYDLKNFTIKSERIPSEYKIPNTKTELHSLYCDWEEFDNNGNKIPASMQEGLETIILISNSEIINIAKDELAYVEERG